MKSQTNIETALNQIQQLLAEQQTASKPLTISEAAAYLDLSVGFLYQLVHYKKLPYLKPAKRIYFLESDLRNYILKNRIKSEPELEQAATEYLTSNN